MKRGERVREKERMSVIGCVLERHWERQRWCVWERYRVYERETEKEIHSIKRETEMMRVRDIIRKRDRKKEIVLERERKIDR